MFLQIDLDELLKNIKSENPNCGEVMVQGILIHKGIKIPREKLRAAVHRVDHENTVRLSLAVVRILPHIQMLYGILMVITK